MNPRHDKKRDMAERIAHLEEMMACCHWPLNRGIAAFLEMDAVEFHRQIAEQQYWDEEWKDYIEEQHTAIIKEYRVATYEDDWDSYDEYA